jgi:hypothetical protein
MARPGHGHGHVNVNVNVKKLMSLLENPVVINGIITQ